MIFAAIVAAASSFVLPADRLAMADKMFARGDAQGARAEYAALKGAEGVAPDDILYRIAECDAVSGDKAKTKASAAALLAAHPLSRHAPRARLLLALASEGRERLEALRLLDTPSTPPEIRAEALFRYGSEAGDADALERCAKLLPAGRFAQYALFRRAVMRASSPDAAVRRAATGELYEIHRTSKDAAIAKEALYCAATASYSMKRYRDASMLFRRYMTRYPGDAKEGGARVLAAWSDYLDGRYAEAAALCGDGATEDAAWILAMCAYRAGDMETAKARIEKYLAAWPDGRRRESLELPLAAVRREAASKAGDWPAFLAAAKRCAELSHNADDALLAAWALEKNAREAEAAAAYAAVARDFPSTPQAADALFRRAMACIRAGNWRAAELSLAEALASGSLKRERKAEALYWRGASAAHLGMEAEGAAFMAQALELGLPIDEAREARLAIADAALAAGREAEAKAAYATLVREGAARRMDGAKLRKIGRFLLDCAEGENAADAAAICAGALAEAATAPEWKQAAYALLGAAREAAGEYSAAIGAYRQALAEDVRTADAPPAALALGMLLAKAGETSEAERTLKEAVHLNRNDQTRRARAYLWLAKCREAAGDADGACAYATVVTTLFGSGDCAAEAAEIIAAHPEAGK